MNVSSHTSTSVILICETKRDLLNVWNIDGGSEYARNIYFNLSQSTSTFDELLFPQPV
jgi:hypothetical protein